VCTDHARALGVRHAWPLFAHRRGGPAACATHSAQRGCVRGAFASPLSDTHVCVLCSPVCALLRPPSLLVCFGCSGRLASPCRFSRAESSTSASKGSPYPLTSRSHSTQGAHVATTTETGDALPDVLRSLCSREAKQAKRCAVTDAGRAHKRTEQDREGGRAHGHRREHTVASGEGWKANNGGAGWPYPRECVRERKAHAEH
jgi:hypothetical protein